MVAAVNFEFERQRYVGVLEAIANHPNSAILRALAGGPRRFNEVAAELAATVSEAAVSSGLRELDADGLVARRVDPGPPLRVLYELTGPAIELGPALRILAGWVERQRPAPPEVRPQA
jgi:DNA-binding HxlR family transcriptional regulator